MTIGTDALRVLLLDDHAQDAVLVDRWFREAGSAEVELTHVRSLEKAIDHLRDPGCDAVLVDPIMSKDGGLPLLERVIRAAGGIPVMVLTSFDHPDLVAQVMKLGAQDFLVKARMNGRALARCIRYAFWRRQGADTLKRTEEQLRHAQKMEIVGRLAGGVAHDFNNLLTVIIGYTDLLLTTVPPEDPKRSQIEAVNQAGRQGVAVTRQLLALSRKQESVPVSINLNQLLARMEKVLRRLLGEDLEMAIRPDDRIGIVKADNGQMEQLVLNLAVNARDAMPKGGTLTIETAAVEIDDDYVRVHLDARKGPHAMISVTDTGTGMPKEILDHLFEPYFTTKERGKGTGLGLSTVYGIVKQVGGHITVASEPGAGTSFRIFLPCVQGAEQRSQATTGHGVESRVSGRLLVVEDEDGVRSFLKSVLQAAGYEVLEARDGTEATRLLETNKESIHLLMTDVVMPRMGGIELAKRATALCPDIKILFLSGYADQTPDLLRAEGFNRQDLLMKPFSPDALRRTLRRLLNNGTAQGEVNR